MVGGLTEHGGGLEWGGQVGTPLKSKIHKMERRRPDEPGRLLAQGWVMMSFL